MKNNKKNFLYIRYLVAASREEQTRAEHINCEPFPLFCFGSTVQRLFSFNLSFFVALFFSFSLYAANTLQMFCIMARRK